MSRASWRAPPVLVIASTCYHAHMKRVMLQFPESYLEDLDHTAGQIGISRAELARIAISHWTTCPNGELEFRRVIADRVLGND